MLIKQENILEATKSAILNKQEKPTNIKSELGIDKQTSQEYDYSKPTFTVKGTVRKEVIPEELELGEYWYWFYFDDPYLLVENAVGYPLFIEKLQITDSIYSNFKIEEYINKHVILNFQLGAGYAESTVMEPIAIMTLK
jgi:hypothetical protein